MTSHSIFVSICIPIQLIFCMCFWLCLYAGKFYTWR